VRPEYDFVFMETSQETLTTEFLKILQEDWREAGSS
jgi:hypothetical protein